MATQGGGGGRRGPAETGTVGLEARGILIYTHMAMETWISVSWAEKYEVSCKGRIRSWHHGVPKPHGKHKNPAGYITATLARAEKTPKTVYMHRLVAETHIGDIPPGHVVHHKNGKRCDNRKTNLEIVTPSQNLQERNNDRPLAPLKAKAVEMLYNEHWTIADIAGATGVSERRVKNYLEKG